MSSSREVAVAQAVRIVDFARRGQLTADARAAVDVAAPDARREAEVVRRCTMRVLMSEFLSTC